MVQKHNSTEAELHKNAKRILSKYDGEIDKKIFSNPKTASDISSKLKAGKIRVVFKTFTEHSKYSRNTSRRTKSIT